MSLSPRQTALYQHTVNIWRETESFGADGKDGGTGVDFDVFGTGP